MRPHVPWSPTVKNGTLHFAVELDGATIDVTYDGHEVCAPISGSSGQAVIEAVRAYIASQRAEVDALLGQVATPRPATAAFGRTCKDVDRKS